MVQSTEAIIDEQGIILFPAPNDGSISKVIDIHNIVFMDGKIEYEERFYHIVDENGIVHSLTLVGTEKLKIIFNIFNEQLALKNEELDVSNSRNAKAAEIISRNKRAFIDLKKAVVNLQEENRKYKSIYGNFSNPYLVLQELYKSGRVGKLHRLIKPEEFRQNTINTKNKKNREPVQYWLALFELWEILDSDGNIRYAKMSYEFAKKTLKEKLMEKDIGYVSDNLTNGGENLSQSDKDEITKELEEEFKE